MTKPAGYYLADAVFHVKMVASLSSNSYNPSETDGIYLILVNQKPPLKRSKAPADKQDEPLLREAMHQYLEIWDAGHKAPLSHRKGF